MSAAQPEVDRRTARRLENRRRNRWTALVVLVAVVVLFLVVLLNAGRWGVPGFSFTNERGSRCKNDLIGVTCAQMTLEDVAHRAQIELPAGATLTDGTYTEAGNFDLTGQLTVPGASAAQARETLRAKFGECRGDLASPLAPIEGIQDICVMSNDFPGASLGGGPPPERLWSVSTGVLPDQNLAVHLHIRSR